jgi:ABC-type amino acid transport system permease subunit
MNYGISILFRAIPLLMALFCFGYGAFVLHEGLDSAKFVAGPVIFLRDDLHCLVRHSGNNH